MIGKILGSMTVILDQDNGSLGYLGIRVQKILQLLHINCLESHVMYVIHQLLKILLIDFVWRSGGILADGVEHHHHDDRSRCRIGGSPFILQVLAAILNISMGCIQWIE